MCALVMCQCHRFFSSLRVHRTTHCVGPRRVGGLPKLSLAYPPIPPPPLVHSPLVILGNHTVLPPQPYNEPCRDLFRMVAGVCRGIPGEVGTRSATLPGLVGVQRESRLESALLWRLVSASTNRSFSALRKSLSSRASFRTPSLNTRRFSRMIPKTSL